MDEYLWVGGEEDRRPKIDAASGDAPAPEVNYHSSEGGGEG